MTGPEHYREAERLLDKATEMEQQLAKTEYDPEPFAHSMLTIDSTRREAQVHATLALAAASAHDAVRDWLGDEARDGRDWTGVL